MRTAAGGPHPCPAAFRQTANPLPYFPPMTKAPFFSPGTRTMQCDLSRRSWGIDLSGVPMISESMTAASSNRSVTFCLSSLEKAGAQTSAAAASVNEIHRMALSYRGQRHRELRYIFGCNTLERCLTNAGRAHLKGDSLVAIVDVEAEHLAVP